MAHDHGSPHRIERLTDVAVIGGSAAGLAAALQLGRVRRDVIVVDAGTPRNAPAAHAHGYLGHEGIAPGDLTAIGRAEVRSYGVEVLDETVSSVHPAVDGRFRVELAGGHAILARRVLVATGLVDELPAVDGLTGRWGRDVLHCPFCHGFEFRDRRLVQLVVHPLGLHIAPLLLRLAGALTVVLHDGVEPGDPAVGRLREGGARIVEAPARRIVVEGDGLRAVELADGTTVDADAVLTGVRFRPRLDPFEVLALTANAHPTGLGTHLATEPTGATAVTGVYAAGNVTDPTQQLLQAAAQGSWVGGQIAVDLAADDLAAGRVAGIGRAEWDARFSGGRTFSGNPNGTLVAEVAELPPGRVLDVGAGEGADAVWLAERGWDVTATDVSARALDHVRAAADEAGVDVTCLHSDASGLHPFGSRTFDLVSAQYAVIPRSPDDRGIANLLDAVAPGGQLLFVHHDDAALGDAPDPMPFDGAASVRPADVAAAVETSPDFELVVDERRARPGGHATVDVPDLVVRARRRHPSGSAKAR